MPDLRMYKIGSQFKSENDLELPLVALRGMVVLPNVSLGFDVSRPASVAAVQEAMKGDRLILLTPQYDGEIEEPGTDDLPRVACLCAISDLVESNLNQVMRVRADALLRCEIVRFTETKKQFRALCRPLVKPPRSEEDCLEMEACRRAIIKRFQNLLQLSNRPGSDLSDSLNELSEPEDVVDVVATHIDLDFESMLDLLLQENPKERMYAMLVFLEKERRLAGYSASLEERVKQAIDEGQREYYLREQLKVIQEELGEAEDEDAEIAAYREKLKALGLKPEARERVEKEIRKLAKMPAGFPDGAVLRNYLELIFDLPWGKMAEEKLNLGAARRQLDKDHYGLEKVKARLLEYLAVRSRQIKHDRQDAKAPILCLVGPPGVGKTSVAMSIAKALGRPYVRMSLGGVRDEAEIRGHRRTYIGSMPGRLINAIKSAKVDNPLILMDEVDKLGHDFRGDPASALLEVLDPEQNKAFNDHYLELDYDLSHVLFLTTANSQENIPAALLDRMEIIELNGYTEEEKYNIARLHLWPKQRALNVVGADRAKLLKEGLMCLIRDYTREAGVRQLEQALARLCRRIALLLSEKEEREAAAQAESAAGGKARAGARAAAQEGPEPERVWPLRLDRAAVTELLGKARYPHSKEVLRPRVGQATGLAWTAVGGETLSIEVAVLPGSGKLELTGQLGSVMQESAKVALAYIRSKCAELRLDGAAMAKLDIHVHVPEGATPKDGPSAGITLATALYSALAKRPVRGDVAMTGEITMRGRVLQIGGLKEKLIAAHRAGIKLALIPKDNLRDIDELPASVKKGVRIQAVESAEEVLRLALLSEVKAKA